MLSLRQNSTLPLFMCVCIHKLAVRKSTHADTAVKKKKIVEVKKKKKRGFYRNGKVVFANTVTCAARYAPGGVLRRATRRKAVLPSFASCSWNESPTSFFFFFLMLFSFCNEASFTTHFLRCVNLLYGPKKEKDSLLFPPLFFISFLSLLIYPWVTHP